MAGIRRTTLLPSYSFVMLLIGVNNQYRGGDSRIYAIQFAQLLQQAHDLCGNSAHVFVLSIPDWGVSPFAAGLDRQKIALEIDRFNSIARDIAGEKDIAFVDITEHSRTAGADPAAFTADGFHPEKIMYHHWAVQLTQRIAPLL